MIEKKYIKPSVEVIEYEIKDHILSPSDNVLGSDNIVEDDPTIGWGDLH